MSKTLLLIFNHQFTPAQKADARSSLGVERIETMPDEIRQIWGNVPPDLPEIGGYLTPVKEWLAEHSRPGDVVLIQGDFGATCLMVRFALEQGYLPVYSTTRREAVEAHQPDGSVRMTHHFRHVRFRRYLD
ncbi:MAG: CRISPR-associated protein Csx20 [Desulfococcaceae bacterium]